MIILIGLTLLSAVVLAAAIACGTLWYAADAMEKYNAD